MSKTKQTINHSTNKQTGCGSSPLVSVYWITNYLTKQAPSPPRIFQLYANNKKPTASLPHLYLYISVRPYISAFQFKWPPKLNPCDRRTDPNGLVQDIYAKWSVHCASSSFFIRLQMLGTFSALPFQRFQCFANSDGKENATSRQPKLLIDSYKNLSGQVPYPCINNNSTRLICFEIHPKMETRKSRTNHITPWLVRERF